MVPLPQIRVIRDKEVAVRGNYDLNALRYGFSLFCNDNDGIASVRLADSNAVYCTQRDAEEAGRRFVRDVRALNAESEVIPKLSGNTNGVGVIEFHERRAFSV